MTKSLFITATGTDVGKTYISGLILKAMREQGYNCGYYKPALSGAEVVDGKLIPGDCQYVLSQAALDLNPMDYVSYVYTPAVSPHLASKIENNPVKLTKIMQDYKRISEEFEYLIVEGAGGITCPFNIDEKLLLPDVIKSLDLGIIIVASAELGTINSTILTVEYAKQHDIPIEGIILNNFDADDYMHLDNKEQIEFLTGIKVLTTVARGEKNINIELIKTAFS